MTRIFFFSSTSRGRDHYFQEALDGLNVSVANVHVAHHEIVFMASDTVWHFVVVATKYDIERLYGYNISATLYTPDWNPVPRIAEEMHFFLRDRLSRNLRVTVLDRLPPP